MCPSFLYLDSRSPPSWGQVYPCGNDGKKGMTRRKRHAALVIPAEAGIQVTGRTGWIPAPRFRGDMLTSAGMTVSGIL